MNFSAWYLHKTLLCVSGERENQHREGSTYLVVLNNFHANTVTPCEILQAQTP